MKLRYIILVISLPLILACGIQSAALQSQQTKGDLSPTPAIFLVQTATLQPTAVKTQAVRQMTILGGTWNIRSSPSLGDKTKDDNITGLLKKSGDVVTVYGLPVRGWLQIDGGWICNRAFGGEDECK